MECRLIREDFNDIGVVANVVIFWGLVPIHYHYEENAEGDSFIKKIQKHFIA